MDDHMNMHLMNPEPVKGVLAKNYCVYDCNNGKMLINVFKRKCPSYSNIPCGKCKSPTKWIEWIPNKKINCSICRAENIKNFHRCSDCKYNACKDCVETFPNKKLIKIETVGKEVREMASLTKMMTLYTLLKYMKKNVLNA